MPAPAELSAKFTADAIEVTMTREEAKPTTRKIRWAEIDRRVGR